MGIWKNLTAGGIGIRDILATLAGADRPSADDTKEGSTNLFLTAAERAAIAAMVVLPRVVNFFHVQSVVTVGNALARTTPVDQIFNYQAYQNAAANGDTFTQDFTCAAGTYSFSSYGSSTTDRGRIDWYIDATKVVSLEEWYAASAGDILKTTSSIAITAGAHTLSGVVNGKHASSSGYKIVLAAMWLVRTGA